MTKSTAKKRPMGRPAFVPTDRERAQVEALAGFGLPIKSIAILVRDGIDHETVMKHFRKELDRGKAKANAKIGQTLFQQAINGNTAAAIFWAKAQMGWRESMDIAVGEMPKSRPLVTL